MLCLVVYLFFLCAWKGHFVACDVLNASLHCASFKNKKRRACIERGKLSICFTHRHTHTPTHTHTQFLHRFLEKCHILVNWSSHRIFIAYYGQFYEFWKTCMKAWEPYVLYIFAYVILLKYSDSIDGLNPLYSPWCYVYKLNSNKVLLWGNLHLHSPPTAALIILSLESSNTTENKLAVYMTTQLTS